MQYEYILMQQIQQNKYIYLSSSYFFLLSQPHMLPYVMNRSNTNNGDGSQIKQYSIRKNGSIHTSNSRNKFNLVDNNSFVYNRANTEHQSPHQKFREIDYKDRTSLIRQNYKIKQTDPNYRQNSNNTNQIGNNFSFNMQHHDPYKYNSYRQISESEKVLKLKPLVSDKFTEQTKIKKSKKKSYVRPCGSPNCKICNKDNQIRKSKQHLTYLTRKKTKPPIPFFPFVNGGKNVYATKKPKVRTIADQQDDLQILFDENQRQKKNLKQQAMIIQKQRRVKSVMQNQKPIDQRSKKLQYLILPQQNFYNKQFRNHIISKYYTENEYQPQAIHTPIVKHHNVPNSYPSSAYPYNSNVPTKKYKQKKIVKIDNKLYEVIQDEEVTPKRMNTSKNQRLQNYYSSNIEDSRVKKNKSRVSPYKINTIDLEKWQNNKQQKRIQRQIMNKQVQRFFKYNTQYYKIVKQNNDNRLFSQKKEEDESQINLIESAYGLSRINVPQKVMLYKFKDYTQSKMIKQNNERKSEQNSPDKKQYSKFKQYVNDDLERSRTENKLSSNDNAQQDIKEVYKIHFPTLQQIQESISNYVPLTGQVNIEILKKSKDYIRQYSSEAGKQFLYFGGYDNFNKQRKGFGVLVTKKLILEGVWMKGNILRGAQLRSNSIYKGQFKNNKKSGQGTCKWLNGEEYMGQWQNGLRNGQGSWKNKDSTQKYSGEWKNGKVNGYGEYTKKNYSVYRGYFQNFIKNGQGVEQFQNGDRFQGFFLNGLPNGRGTYIWQCGLAFQGDFKKGLREGKGRLRKQDLFNIQGSFQNERPHGICQLRLANQDIFNGKFVYGQKYGFGKLEQNGGNFIEEGFWNHEKLEQRTNDIHGQY